MIDKILCKECAKGCILDIYKYNGKVEVEGNKCGIGKDYGVKRVRDNNGILTTLVRIKGSAKHNVVSVKSSDVIDKKLWIECSKALSRIHIGPPISIGDVICKNILNTGVDILSTVNIQKD